MSSQELEDLRNYYEKKIMKYDEKYTCIKNSLGEEKVTTIGIRETAINKESMNLARTVINEHHQLKGGFLRDNSLIRDYAEHLIFAYVNGEFAGFCSLDSGQHVRKNEEGSDLHILQIGLKKSMQGMGVASSLLKYIEEHSLGHSCVSAEVHKKNYRSERFFRQNGYKVIESKVNPDQLIALKDMRHTERKDFKYAKRNPFRNKI